MGFEMMSVSLVELGPLITIVPLWESESSGGHCVVRTCPSAITAACSAELMAENSVGHISIRCGRPIQTSVAPGE